MRGLTTADELNYGLAKLAPVGALENIDAAAELVISKRDERIVVVGDFDVDGATSTALVLRCLREFGFKDVEYLVPNRFDYGYGLTPEIVDVAARQSPQLLITVDNGVSSIDGVARANELQIPVLVTDHHLPGDELPAAAVIVNPNLKGSNFPSRNLAGVGVAFYLVARIGRLLEEQGQVGAAKIPARYLDLVALGTVADVVPLDHNNRVLVQQGLARMRAGHAVPGIKALLQQSGRSVARCVSTDLGFAVGPRINAAGRLEDISIGIECLLTDSADTASEYARVLDKINSERRDIEATMREQAFRYVDQLQLAPGHRRAHRRKSEGALSSSSHCLCTRGRELSQGFCALNSRRAHSRSARSGINCQAGPYREIRRPCDGGGTYACGIGAG